MSYDLYFKSRNGSVDQNRIVKYFENRKNYKVKSMQAWYTNEDTGVYFVFGFGGSDDDNGTPAASVSLNINYFRPHYFALEAEQEISKLVQAFDFTIIDPQIDGMGKGEYRANAFITGWNRGNELGYAAVISQPNGAKELRALPSAVLGEIWRWNYGRTALQDHLGESKFVPRVMFFLLDQRPVTAVVWPDGIAAAIPPVDYLIVPRKEFAPRRFFQRREDRTLVAWRDAVPVLERNSTKKLGSAFVLAYEKPPKDVVNFVESLRVDERKISGLSADSVLDLESVQRAIGRQAPQELQ